MKVLLFGATGMIGQGVLNECLADSGVHRVVSVGRRASGRVHEKLLEIVQPDVADVGAYESELEDVEACFFCLGVSALGMTEEQYARVTHDLTLSVAERLVRAAPSSVFVYVSGLGTDSTERGAQMWARVKGRTENALLALPFRAAYMFRPGIVQPMDGAGVSKAWYRFVYVVTAPIIPLLRRAFPGLVTTTARIGQAMLSVARRGYASPLVETRDINLIAQSTASD